MNPYIRAILAKEFKSDFRNPYVLAGAGLFLLSSLFVCYITIKRIAAPSLWVALYWIIVLFASFNVVAKSFHQEQRGRLLYLYSLTSPSHYIIAKMCYHGTLMLLMSCIAVVVYSLLFEMPVTDLVLFWFSIVLGGTGIAFLLSLLSSIAAKAGNNLTLLAILGLPVMLPIMMVNTTLMKNAIDGLSWSVQWKYALVLTGLNIVSFALSVVLFPYLWRE